MSFSGNYAGKYQVQIVIVPLDSNSPPRTRRRQQKAAPKPAAKTKKKPKSA
jgi:hypothetical protein